MSEITKFENLQKRIIEIRNENVLLDADVAEIYGVQTRDINKAVANNPGKFPTGYIVELTTLEKSELVENFHRFNKLKHSTVNPKAFPEKGLLYACHHSEKPAGSSGHIGDHRNLFQNQGTLPQYQDSFQHQG